jgi:hypothetical protein
MKIEIISGSYGWRKTKDAMPKLVERGGICEVDEAEARRLVALGVAAIVHEADEAPVASGSTVESGDIPCVDMPSAENGAESDAEAHLDPEQLKTLTKAKLTELAKEMGIDTAKLKTKAQLIAAITDVPLEDAIAEDDDGVDDGEAPPVLTPEAPVV